MLWWGLPTRRSDGDVSSASWAPELFDALERWRKSKQEEATVRRWACTEEVLAMAAQAASDGRLEVAVRSWAVRELVAAGGPASDRERIAVLLAAVRRSMLSVPNPVGAQWISGADVAVSGGTTGGSCVDYCVKLGAALLSVGIRVALIGQATSGGETFDHVAMAAWDGHRWVRVDPSDRAMQLGDSRSARREVWIHLPEGEVVHDGAPPTRIRAPEPADQSSFLVVGVGRLSPPRPDLVSMIRSPGLGSEQGGGSWFALWLLAGIAIVALAVAAGSGRLGQRAASRDRPKRSVKPHPGTKSRASSPRRRPRLAGRRRER